MRFALLGLVGAVMVFGTPAHAQNIPGARNIAGAPGRGSKLRLRQLCAVHGNGFRHRRLLCAKYDVPAAAEGAEEEKSLKQWNGVAGVSASSERSNLAAPY